MSYYETELIHAMYNRIYYELSEKYTNLPDDIIYRCIDEAKEKYIENLNLFTSTTRIQHINRSESVFRDFAFECIQKLQQTLSEVMMAILLSRERRPLDPAVQEFCLDLAQLPSRPLEIIDDAVQNLFNEGEMSD